jgi:hypothetical protein
MISKFEKMCMAKINAFRMSGESIHMKVNDSGK